MDFQYKKPKHEVIERLKNLTLNSIATLSKLLSFFLLAKFLSSEDFGFFSIFLSLVSFGALIIGGEYYAYSNREIIKTPIQHRQLVLYHHIIAIIIIYITIIPLQIILFQSILEKTTYTIWFLIILITEHLVNEQSRLLVALNKQIQASFVLFLRSVPLLLMIITTNSSITIKSALLAWAISNILSIIFGLNELKKHIPINKEKIQFNKKTLTKGFKISIIYLFSTVALQGILTLDRIIISKFDIVQAGVYSFFMILIMGLTSILTPLIFSFLYPRLIKYHNENNLLMYKKTCSELFFSTIIASIFLYVTLFLAIDGIIKLVNKPLYIDYLNSFNILIIAGFFYNLSHVPQFILYSLGKDKWILISNLTAFIIFLFNSLFIIDQFYSTSSIMKISISLLIAILSLIIVRSLAVFTNQPRIL